MFSVVHFGHHKFVLFFSFLAEMAQHISIYIFALSREPFRLAYINFHLSFYLWTRRSRSPPLILYLDRAPSHNLDVVEWFLRYWKQD